MDATQKFSPPDTVVLAGAGISMLLGQVFSGINLLMGGVLLFCFIADVMSGMAKAIIEWKKEQQPRPHWFNASKFTIGLANKFLILMAVAVAGSMDLLFTQVPGFGLVVEEYTPVVKTALILVIVGQWGSILRNIAVVDEARAVVKYLRAQTAAVAEDKAGGP